MKKFTKILCCVAMLGFFATCALTGCATVGNIKNTSQELIYNGNSAVMVEGYLYYGNAFADTSSFNNMTDYKNNAKLSYLARLNTNEALSAKTVDHSPKGVEMVTKDVNAHSRDFMFVLGQYIYYVTPNTQKATNSEGTASHYFNYSTLYRSKLNGNSKKKLYTTNGEVSNIEVLKTDGTYYVVMLAGENLIKINLSNNKSEVIAEGVKSVALPKTYEKNKFGSTLDWNGVIYYTTEEKNESGSGRTGSVVNCIQLSGGESKEIYSQGTTVEFIGREKDVIFFTEKKGSLETETYMRDCSQDIEEISTNRQLFISSSATAITDIRLVCSSARDLGFVYMVGSNMGFRRTNGSKGTIIFKNGTDAVSTFNVLLVSGRTAYLSTETAVFSADLSAVFAGTSTSVQLQKIVEMTAVQSGKLYAFDGDYIYYYAKLEEVEKEKDEDGNEIEPEPDDNYYLYRAKIGGVDKYDLLGLTQIESRRS